MRVLDRAQSGVVTWPCRLFPDKYIKPKVAFKLARLAGNVPVNKLLDNCKY